MTGGSGGSSSSPNPLSSVGAGLGLGVLAGLALVERTPLELWTRCPLRVSADSG